MAEPRWKTYSDARAFVRQLGLLDVGEWVAYCRGDLEELLGRRPPDIPAGPRDFYSRTGWVNWRDWLGPPPVAPAEEGYLDFKRARRFARSLKLKSAEEWRRWCAGKAAKLTPRPGNVPEDPRAMYPRAWRGWGNWLGTQRRRSRWLPFDRARAWARAQGLGSAREWRDLCTGRLRDAPDLPKGIPATPSMIYRHSGWNGFGDWLGTDVVGSTEKVFLPFEDARAFVRELGLTSTGEYYRWSAGRLPGAPPRPDGVPGSPDVSYQGRGWTTWGDFLGTGNIHPTKREFLPFEEARDFARSLGLAASREWHDFAAGRRADLGTCPLDVPKHPDMCYADGGWQGWGDFLGTGNLHPADREFRSFAKARAFARTLGLRSSHEWSVAVRDGLPDGRRIPGDIPHGAQNYYTGRGWKGWGDFLGTGNRRAADREWLPFAEARAFARSLGLTSAAEWRELVYAERRADAPFPDVSADPARMYRGRGWKGWCDFLGVRRRGRPRRVWRPFGEAREFAWSLGFRSSREWEAWSRGDRPDLAPRPEDIPGVPYVAYANDGWRGWLDFLGTEAAAPSPRVPGTRPGEGRR